MIVGWLFPAHGEQIHPPGGGSPISGIPIPAQQGGTGINGQSTWVDGDCVEAFLDVDGKKKLRTSGDPCGTGSGASPYPTPTVVVTTTPTAIACPTAAGGGLGGLYQAHPELCKAIPATNTPQPTQTPWSCGTNGVLGMGGSPSCFVIPTPDGAGAGAPSAGTYIDVSGSTVSVDLSEVGDVSPWGNCTENPMLWEFCTADGTAEISFDGPLVTLGNTGLTINGGTLTTDNADLTGTVNFVSTTPNNSVVFNPTTGVLAANAGTLRANDVICSGCVDVASEITGTVAVASGGTGNSGPLTGVVRGAGTSLSAAELSGDATTSGSNAVTVVDDSHAHTGATLSGIDISSDTNLSASGGITLTGDNLTADLGTSVDISSETNLSASGGVTLTGDNLTADLGTAIVSSEITDGEVSTLDIADNTLDYADVNYTYRNQDNPSLSTSEQWFGSEGLLFEGDDGADNDEGMLIVPSLSGDREWTLPDASGTVAVSATSPLALSAAGAVSITAGGIGTTELGTDSVSADELNATGVESELEAVLDLADLQGAVTDGQVPNTITVDLATTATTANAGDSATSFFSSGTIEAARLPDADDDASTKGIATFADADMDCTSGSCSIAAAIARDSELPATPTPVGTPGANPTMGANHCAWTLAGGIVCEGATADDIETWIAPADPSGTDKTITWPNETGTVCTTGSVCTSYMGTSTVLGTSQNSTIHGNDDTDRCYGTDTDWCIEYDEAGIDALLWASNADGSATTTDPMFGILGDNNTANGTNMTANKVIFGVGKGTDASPNWVFTVDEDGDLAWDGAAAGAVEATTLTIGGTTATADSRSFLVTTGHAPSTTALNYFWGSVLNSFEVNVNSPAPTAGTLSRLYCSTNGAPGAAKDYTVTVRKNAADCGSFSCQLTGASNPATCNDTTHTCTYAAGDLMALLSTPTGTPSAITLKCTIMLEVTDG